MLKISLVSFKCSVINLSLLTFQCTVFRNHTISSPYSFPRPIRWTRASYEYHHLTLFTSRVGNDYKYDTIREPFSHNKIISVVTWAKVILQIKWPFRLFLHTCNIFNNIIHFVSWRKVIQLIPLLKYYIIWTDVLGKIQKLPKKLTPIFSHHPFVIV